MPHERPKLLRVGQSVREDAELRILLFVALLQSFAYFVPPATWNPMSRFAVTSAIVERGRLDIGPFAEATGDRAFRDGRWYSDKAPLLSLVAVPTYGVVRAVHRVSGRPAPTYEAEAIDGVVAARLRPSPTLTQLLYAVSVATSGMAGALLGVGIFTALRRRGFGARASLASALVCMLGTPLLPYATSFYGHVPAAAALFFALAILDDAAPTRRRVVAQGALLATAVGCEYLSAVPAIVIGIAALVRAGRGAPRVAAGLALGALPVVLVVCGYHAACFGSPLRTGYSFLVDPTFVAGHARGVLGFETPSWRALMGILLGAERGLLRHFPIAALGLIGVAMAVRAHPRDRMLRAGALAFVAMLLANAGYYMWWGGASSGPRHLVPVLPVLAFGLAHLVSRRAWRPAFAVVGALSLFVAVGLTLVGIEARERGDVVFDYLLPRLAEGEIAIRRGASNLGVAVGFPRRGSFGPLIAFWVIVGHALARRACAIDDRRAQSPELIASAPASEVSPPSV